MEQLPGDWHVVAGPDGHLVVGPTGAFALAIAEVPDVDEAAQRAARFAGRIRDELVERLSWAPFVDALVVVDEASPAHAEGASIVPVRMLADVLTAGRQLLAAPDVRRVLAALGAVPAATAAG